MCAPSAIAPVLPCVRVKISSPQLLYFVLFGTLALAEGVHGEMEFLMHESRPSRSLREPEDFEAQLQLTHELSGGK